MSEEKKLYPIHIRDNPVMQGAFAAFCKWAFDESKMRAEFEAHTDTKPIGKKSPMDSLIDTATGFDPETDYARKFFDYIVEFYWGYEGMPDGDGE